MKYELTPLYPPSIKPVRSGIYKAGLTFTEEGYAYWNNVQKKWGWIAPTRQSVNKQRIAGAAQNKYWRGLLKETT